MQPLVRRLIARYGRDPHLREELPGEIYCRFTQLVETFDPTRGVPLRAYLVRSLTASVYSYARRCWRLRHREMVIVDCGGCSAEGEYDLSPHLPCEDPSDQWDDQLLMREVLKALPNAIARLPLRQRQVVIARYYEGRSFEQIALALGIRPSTARSLLRHGVNHLRRSMGGSDPR